MFSPWVLRVTAPLVGVSLLLLGVGVGASRYVHQMQDNVSQGLLVNVSSMRAAEEVEILIREMRTQLDHFLLTANPADLRASPAFRKETEHWLSVAERYSTTPAERDLTTQVRRGYQRFLLEMETLAKRELSDPIPPDDLRVLKQSVRELIDDVMIREIQQPIHAYLDTNEVEVEASVGETQVLADRLTYVLLWLGICGCGAGLVAGYVIARGISRSLIQLSVPIRAAAGQLETLVGPVTFAAGADLGQLEGVLHRMAEQIGTVVERVRQSEREALRAEQLAAVGQMAAGMAHELRNPLTSMKLLVQGAIAQESANPAAGAPDEPVRSLAGHDLRILEEEIIRLEGLLQSFLQFARPPRLERREVDVRVLVGQTIRLVAPRAAQRDICLEWKAPDKPLLISADAGQLSQVLLNLLLNALDAVPTGGVVEIDAAWETDGRLRLEVSDNGPGLPADLGSRIFVPFVTTKETGLGLGLSICKRIVEAHGGSIGAANHLKSGATLTVHLPNVAVDAAASGPSESVRPH